MSPPGADQLYSGNIWQIKTSSRLQQRSSSCSPSKSNRASHDHRFDLSTAGALPGPFAGAVALESMCLQSPRIRKLPGRFRVNLSIRDDLVVLKMGAHLFLDMLDLGCAGRREDGGGIRPFDGQLHLCIGRGIFVILVSIVTLRLGRLKNFFPPRQILQPEFRPHTEAQRRVQPVDDVLVRVPRALACYVLRRAAQCIRAVQAV